MNSERLLENWDNDAVVIREGELPHQILETLASQLDELETDIEDVHDTRFIESASKIHLEKIGEQVGVSRLNQQDDSELRVRVETGYARASSDSTFDTFAKVVLNIFDADEDEVTLRGDDNEPVVIVNTALPLIEESPLTEEQIGNELEDSVPANDGVRVQGTGTFELSGPDHTPSENSGLNEGTLGYVFDA